MQTRTPQSGAGVLIVRNAASGTSVVRFDPAPVIAERLPGATFRELSDGEDFATVIADAMKGDDPDVLGIYGGDGSVARMIELAREYDRPLLVLPGGTFNHFARAAGLDDVDAGIDAFERGRTVRVGLIEASVDDGEPVTAINAVSLGTYPEFLDEREGRNARLGKWLGGVVAAWRTMQTAEPLTIVRNGRRARVWSVFIGIGANDPDQVATMQRGELETGILDVRIHHARGSRLRAVVALAFGRKTIAVLRALRLMPSRGDVERMLVPSIDLIVRPDAGHPSVFVHDGELEELTGAEFRLRCTAVPDAVAVFA